MQPHTEHLRSLKAFTIKQVTVSPQICSSSGIPSGAQAPHLSSGLSTPPPPLALPHIRLVRFMYLTY